MIFVTKLPFKTILAMPARTARSIIQPMDSIWARRISEGPPKRSRISANVAG
jgi:hypothetical protein